MRAKDARRIRAAIRYARAMVEMWSRYDPFTRGMDYRHYQPKNKLAARAYRRTVQQAEYKRAGIWADVRPLSGEPNG